MAKLSALYVAIEDARAKPLSGTQVVVSRVGLSVRSEAEMVAPGSYRVAGLEPATYQVGARAQGFLAEQYRIDVEPGINSLSIVLGQKGQPFYFADGLKVYFEPDEQELLLAVEGSGARAAVTDMLAASAIPSIDVAPTIAGVTREQDPDSLFVSVRLPATDDTGRAVADDLVRRIDQLSEQIAVVPARPVRRGTAPVQGLTNDLVVQFAPGVGREEVDRNAAAAGLSVSRSMDALPNTFVLTADGLPEYSLLDTAVGLLDSDAVMAAEPDLLVQLEVDQFTPSDSLFASQPHLPLTDSDDAWELLGGYLGPDHTGGAPQVCIAVFDPDGVAPDHPELTANTSAGNSKLVTSFNFGNMTQQTVAGLGGDHGTQCAGSATAATNNRGTVGVAPNCRLIGARIPNPATGVMMADAFLWSVGIANGNTNPNFPALPAQPADVISNSWGVSNAALTTALRNAFDRITDDARDGKGAVITFSTGNLGYTQFTNVRRYASYGRTIAVGASINSNPTSPVNSIQADPNGNTNNLVATTDRRAFFNPFGPEMDIVAPSHTCYNAANGALIDPITSTVRVGTGGVDGCAGPAVCMDYSANFGGTSHSSPTVAGAAALAISANSLLSWDEVRAVLRRTAVRIDAGNADPVGNYVDNDGDGIDEFSQWYGYGRLNVAEAVREATKLQVAAFMLFRT